MTNLSILSSFDLGFRNKKNHYELNHYRVWTSVLRLNRLVVFYLGNKNRRQFNL